MEALIYTHKHEASDEEHAKRTDEHRCSNIVEDVDPDEERRNRVSGQLAKIRALKQDVVLLQVDLNRNRDSLSSGRQAAKEAEIAILKETVAALVRPGKRVGESLPPNEQIEKRVAGYYDEIQEKLGISHNLLAREVPELLRFHEKGDCSLEAVATFNCNNNPAANMRQYVDFRFFAPSTCSPVTIAVGPLGSNGFLLLGKRSQATEGDERTFDQRTRPMSEKGEASDYELQKPTFHSLMLKKDETKFEVGVYYLSVCTGGDKLSNCHVRLHIPTPRAPGMDYDWFGIKKRSINKLMEEASRAAWIATKESINSKDVSRKVASGGNRRSERGKTQEHSLFTPTLEFLGRQPIRNLHASLESQTLAGDALFGSPGKANPLQTDISRDVWTRLSKPLLSSTRLHKSGRHEVLRATQERPKSALLHQSTYTEPPGSAVAEHEKSRPPGEMSTRRVYIPKDDLVRKYNAQGCAILRPSSALSRRTCAASPDPERGANMQPAGTVAAKRPASARPASPYTRHGSDSRLQRGLESGVGRVNEWGAFLSERPSSAMARMNTVTQTRSERPSSALARISSASARFSSSQTDKLSGVGGTENAFGSILSSDSRQALKDVSWRRVVVEDGGKCVVKSAGVMTAEQQLERMKQDQAQSVMEALKGTSVGKFISAAKVDNEKPQKLGLKGLIKSHKTDFNQLVERRGVKYLEADLLQYEEKAKERYKLPFVDLFLKVGSARNMPKTGGVCDTYVVMTLADPERGQIGKEKTHTEHKKTNPEWNRNFKFNCRNVEKDAMLTFVCWQHYSSAHIKDLVLGECSFPLQQLVLGKYQKWTLPLQTPLKNPKVPRIYIETFFGKEAAFEEWKKKEEEDRLAKLREENQRKFLAQQQAQAVASGKGKDSVPDDNRKQQSPARAKPSGPIGVLFKKWCVASEGQKSTSNAKSIDIKEFNDMLKALKLMPSKISKHKALEIFRQANRIANDSIPDGDTSEMDWNEFDFAMKKVCEFCKVEPEILITDAADDDSDDESPREKDVLTMESLTPVEEIQKGYAEEMLQTIWQTCTPRSWGKIGVCGDVFDFLISLQEKERHSLEFPPKDAYYFLENPPGIGSAKHVFPDCSAIDLEHISAAPDNLLLYMAQYGGSHIKRLLIGGCNKLTLRAVLTFAEKFRFISSLSLKNHTSVDDNWLYTLSDFLHLQELDISHCIRITDKGLLALVEGCGGLRKLDCSHCSQVSDEGILALSRRCTMLESISIRGCPRVTGLRAAVSSEIFAGVLRRLRSLNVCNCKGFDDKALQHLVGLDSLESLTMHANVGVTDVGLEAIASCIHLTTLDLSRCVMVTNFGIMKIARGCRQMRRLQLDFCTQVSDMGISFIADFNPKLEHLSLRGCTLVTDVSVRGVLKHCPCIAGMDLSNTSANENEIRACIATLQEERRNAQEEEDTSWLVGKRGTTTWTGIEVEATWPTTQPIDCEFSTKEGGFKACDATKFNPSRDLHHTLAVPYMIAQQDREKKLNI